MPAGPTHAGSGAHQTKCISDRTAHKYQQHMTRTVMSCTATRKLPTEQTRQHTSMYRCDVACWRSPGRPAAPPSPVASQPQHKHPACCPISSQITRCGVAAAGLAGGSAWSAGVADMKAGLTRTQTGGQHDTRRVEHCGCRSHNWTAAGPKRRVAYMPSKRGDCAVQGWVNWFGAGREKPLGCSSTQRVQHSSNVACEAEVSPWGCCG